MSEPTKCCPRCGADRLKDRWACGTRQAVFDLEMGWSAGPVEESAQCLRRQLRQREDLIVALVNEYLMACDSEYSARPELLARVRAMLPERWEKEIAK